MLSEITINVIINIVGEYADIDGDSAQAYLECFDDINTVLASKGLPAHTEPDAAIQYSEEDDVRQYMTKFSVSCVQHLQRAYSLMQMVRLLIRFSSTTYTLIKMRSDNKSGRYTIPRQLLKLFCSGARSRISPSVVRHPSRWSRRLGGVGRRSPGRSFAEKKPSSMPR
jgi:hypothetical protein